jgi:hypothetical protein
MHAFARLAAVTAAATVISATAMTDSMAGLPDTIAPPKGLNLGSTSFYDGFGRQTEGFTLLDYNRFETASAINGPTGKPDAFFKGTKLDIYVALVQIGYTTDWQPFGGHFAFSAALPLVDFMQTKFAPASPVKLSNNGTNIGDLVWGPIWQSKIYTDGDRPVFAWRTQLIITSPTGPVNPAKSINQGNGYWTINPYVSFTALPLAGLEFSNRFNYQYNFEGNEFSNPPPIPHVVYKNGQGGQIVYDNFDASYAVTHYLGLGINGYALDQLTPDKTNRQTVSKSLESELYLGPGAHVTISETDCVNVNGYFKVIANNASSGTQLNVQYIHRF